MKILVRLPNWLGDVVMSTAFVSAVREVYPSAEIDIIIKKELGSIASLITGVGKVHLFSKKESSGLLGVFRFGRELRIEKYELFFNLPSSLSSIVMGWATGSKKRIGFKGEGSFLMLSDIFKKPAGVHRVDEYISLLEQFSGETINNKQVKLSADNTGQRNHNQVLINFNSEASSRRMPVEKGIAIVNRLTDTYKNTSFTFIGSPKEAAFIEQVIAGVKKPNSLQNIAGKTSLVELTYLMAKSTLLLTTDSGPAHLANSVGAPVIVLFGAGNEYNTAPYNQSNLTVIRYGKLGCEPCVKNTCELYGVPKCLELIDELRIINAMSVYLPHA